MPTVTLLPDNSILEAAAGETLRDVLLAAGVYPDAPCGGQGTCGKCRVLVDGAEALACRTPVDRDMTVTLPESPLADATSKKQGTALAFDIGTTTLVCSLLDKAGAVVARRGVQNPQVAFGADVVSRLRAAEAGHRDAMTRLIRNAMEALVLELCVDPGQIQTVSVVGNPAMQQLFLGMDVTNLTHIPFRPLLSGPEIRDCAAYLSVCPGARLLVVPDISGFVGADTVAAVLSCGMAVSEELTLLVDIGTNAEMVLGSRKGMVACAAAAGPALEGANISCGMRAQPGAIQRVWTEKGGLRVSEENALGICGSGLIDAVAAALDLGLLNRRGRIQNLEKKIMLTDRVYLTQEDIRQVQLAKGAIRAGITLMAEHMGVSPEDIQRVVLAGAFGSVLDPGSACRIGLLPDVLLDKITAVGNAAGDGAVLLAAETGLLDTASGIVESMEYLDLSSLAAFPRTFAKAMELPEDWCQAALSAGFTHALPLDPALLEAREDVRDMCAQDKCRAYGKNWTCPPHCGSLSDCQERMHGHHRGILLQTVGQLRKPIDSRGYRDTERRHLESFGQFCQAIRRQYPHALCLGSGGCRVCKVCAWPEPCRFPEKALSSMEGYGLFVTQVCRDCGAEYHHGEKTVTYTACVLY